MRISSLVAGLALCAALPIAACTPHIFDTFDIEQGQSLSIDAKQRIVLITSKGGPYHNHLVVCSEPSPDALAATAAALSLSGGNGAAQGQLAGSLTEAAANIGLRTPTIQLLRDGLYEACEAYLNGVLAAEDYGLLLRNYDRVMVALLALDAASGSPRAQNITINAGDAPSPAHGSSGAAQNGAAAGSGVGSAGSSTSKSSSNGNGQSGTGAGMSGSSTGGGSAGPGTADATKAALSGGIANADQVMKAVADYMLDDSKWILGTCLTSLWAIAVPQQSSSDDSPSSPSSPSSPQPAAVVRPSIPTELQLAALRDIEHGCGQILLDHRLGTRRDFASDTKPDAGVQQKVSQTQKASGPQQKKTQGATSLMPDVVSPVRQTLRRDGELAGEVDGAAGAATISVLNKFQQKPDPSRSE
jgi:hypothetical protein